MVLRRYLEPRLLASWYAPQRDALALALAPLEGVYAAAVLLRDGLRRAGWSRASRLPVPVVVVGNLTAGGSGKTPMVIWLARQLTELGLRPGVLCRGYGGRDLRQPRRVDAGSDADAVGDEAVLLALKTGCAVAAGGDRVAAARLLLAGGGIDLLICDDGLQHYALGRDLEILMINGRRRFGNRRLLPAGPLREPLARLARCNFIIERGPTGEDGEECLSADDPLAGDTDAPAAYGELRVTRTALYRFAAPAEGAALYGDEVPLTELRGRRLHAFAGIADPAAFFDALRALGARPVEHARPDHHRYAASDFSGLHGEALVMTAKDAVKCRRLAPPGAWVLDIEMAPDTRTAGRVLAAVRTLLPQGVAGGRYAAIHRLADGIVD